MKTISPLGTLLLLAIAPAVRSHADEPSESPNSTIRISDRLSDSSATFRTHWTRSFQFKLPVREKSPAQKRRFVITFRIGALTESALEDGPLVGLSMSISRDKQREHEKPTQRPMNDGN